MHHDPQEIISTVTADGGLELISWEPSRSDFSGNTRQYGYQVTVRDASGAESTVHLFVSEPPERGPSAMTGAPASDPDLVWIYPNDPELPALPAATVPAAVEVMLGRLGYAGPVTGLTMLSYRPGRRAVLRVETPGGRAYLKVVAPTKAAAMRALHEEFLAGGLPVPPVLAFSPEGLLLFAELPGIVAAERLQEVATDPRFLGNLDALRAALSAVPCATVSRPGPTERWDWYAARLSEVLPQEAGRIDEVRAVLAEAARVTPRLPGVRHGDLHLEQLMVDPESPWVIVGLLDIDTAGHGDPLGDASGFVAELIRRAEVAHHDGEESAAAAAESLASAALARWCPAGGTREAVAWHAACAAHLLAHALAPAGMPASRPLGLRLLRRSEYAADLAKSSLTPGLVAP